MRHMKVIDDERGIETWINPLHVTMWRAHWTGPGVDRRGHDSTRTDVFFPGEDSPLTVRMGCAEFAAAWSAATEERDAW